MAKEKDSKKKVKPPSKVAKAAGVEALVAPSEAEYLLSRESAVDKEETLDIVSFYLSGSLYAVEVDHVGAVIMFREVVELPHTPEFIDGLISVRGDMILVMNLKKRLGIDKGADLSGNIIVTEHFSTAAETGLVVDKMAGVMEVAGFIKAPQEKLRGKKGALGGKDADFIKGTVESADKELIKVLDIGKLIAFDMPAGVA